MAGRCLLYYITDRKAFPGDELARRQAVLQKIAEAARCGIDYIQLREKDLSGRELETLGREAVQTIANCARPAGQQRRSLLLINSRTDVAMTSGADGVHLRSDDVLPGDAKDAWERGARAGSQRKTLIGVSCHTVEEVARAASQSADFAVIAPVFEKKDAPGEKLARVNVLRAACRASIPVLALGGVTLENAASCLDAGAAGVAAIRLFQENEIAEVVRKLRRSIG